MVAREQQWELTEYSCKGEQSGEDGKERRALQRPDNTGRQKVLRGIRGPGRRAVDHTKDRSDFDGAADCCSKGALHSAN